MKISTPVHQVLESLDSVQDLELEKGTETRELWQKCVHTRGG